MPTSPLPSRGPHGGEKSIWQHHPCLLGVPIVGRNQFGNITPAFSGSPWWRNQYGYITCQLPIAPPQVAFHATSSCHGGLCSSVLDTNPRGMGGGGGRGVGGQSKFFSILGAFLNSPFHSEHFEYTEVGLNFGFTRHNK